MRLPLFALICLAYCAVAQEEDGDLNSLLNQVFPKPNASRPTTSNNNQQARPISGTGTGLNLNPSPPVNGDNTCTTEDNQPGECVQYYLCNGNNSIIVDGTGILDIRRQGPCESYMEVCCLPPSRTEEIITPPPPVVPRPTGCGIRNPDGVGFRITGDKDGEAQFGEFPWMVAILREEPVAASGQKLNVYQCGGSLIHPQVVLTAAHCIPKSVAAPPAGGAAGAPPKLKVRAGEWDTQTKNEIFPHQDRIVSKIVSHDHYYPGGLFNDIALLFLESPIDEAENIGVVCLPPSGSTAPQARCMASGWGKDVFGKAGRYQVILKKVELPTVEKARCQSALRKTRLGPHFELHRTFICAGGEPGKDVCKGDGGSPLICPVPGQPDRYMQSGIVAWGIGCGETGTPGVYANVAILRDWINEQLIYNNIDMTGYEL